jgi:hypothetical protein
VVNISQRNIAPSVDHLLHDVYGFCLAPETAQPFVFVQSVGGGHAEQGGSASLALEDLTSWKGDWRRHLQNAGCPWVIKILQAAIESGDTSSAIKSIMHNGFDPCVGDT